MDVVDSLPVFQLQHQQKMEPTVSIQVNYLFSTVYISAFKKNIIKNLQEKEDQETVEVNAPEMPIPVPDLTEPPVINEVY